MLWGYAIYVPYCWFVHDIDILCEFCSRVRFEGAWVFESSEVTVRGYRFFVLKMHL